MVFMPARSLAGAATRRSKKDLALKMLNVDRTDDARTASKVRVASQITIPAGLKRCIGGGIAPLNERWTRRESNSGHPLAKRVFCL